MAVFLLSILNAMIWLCRVRICSLLRLPLLLAGPFCAVAAALSPDPVDCAAAGAWVGEVAMVEVFGAWPGFHISHGQGP